MDDNDKSTELFVPSVESGATVAESRTNLMYPHYSDDLDRKVAEK